MKAVIGLGVPVAPIADRSYEYGFLKTCSKPKLFVSGEHDQFGPRKELERLVESAPEPKKLVDDRKCRSFLRRVFARVARRD